MVVSNRLSTNDAPPINRQRLLQRLLDYTRIGTPADPASETYPSSAVQKDLGRLLEKELLQMSADDVRMDPHGLVWATVPATDGISSSSPTVALIAHMDTSPEAPGVDVKPQVIEHYQGGDITLENGETITVDSTPQLKDLIGCTLITTDGSMLSGRRLD
ncbi:MAG: peptidase T, partial [Planctomycetota bacterium]